MERARKLRRQEARPYAVRPSAPAPTSAFAFEASVDGYGYHETAGGWFFSGWMRSQMGPLILPTMVTALFEGMKIADQCDLIIYRRLGAVGGSYGFALLLRAPVNTERRFLQLAIELDGMARRVDVAPDAAALRGPALRDHVRGLADAALDEAERDRLAPLLLAVSQAPPALGYIDYYGYHPAAGGWLIAGWVAQGWSQGSGPAAAAVVFEGGELRELEVVKLYHRPDLAAAARGAIFFVPDRLVVTGALCALGFMAGGLRHACNVNQEVERLAEAELARRIGALLCEGVPEARRSWLMNVLSRRPYDGEDTLEAFRPAVNLYIDEAIATGAGGLALMGWLLAEPNYIAALRVRCGELVSVLDQAGLVRIARPDVLAAFPEFGGEETRCGFVAYLADAVTESEPIYIEVECSDGRMGYKPVRRPRLRGLDAIRRLLDLPDERFHDIQRAFGDVLGPAVAALNEDRLARPSGETILTYGAAPAAPKYSVIVPLHGRLDFLEYQQALFSAHPAAGLVEYIYVLDDPSLRREAAYLGVSVYERFQVPVTIVHLEQNLGYAPANNVGLRHARGEFVAFLNSDVFPGTPDWLARLAARLEADARLGAVGPLLLYEDGTVQHQGMFFKAEPEFGGWYYCQHQDKGQRYAGGEALRPSVVITGACLVMRRALAESLGGFDETYVVGDFEDSDLCMRIREAGLDCAVDPLVRLYHLERQSQGRSSSRWRMNLTAYNAWRHHQRWAAAIEAQRLA